MSQATAHDSIPLITVVSDYCRKVLDNRATLPSMPDVAAKIHNAMASPNWSFGTVASIIKGDPGTTTYLLQMANSALYGAASPIHEVENAIARLGMDNARNLVMAHALRSMFVTRSQMLGRLMQRTWQSSARLAALCAVLARQFGRYPPERALLAGLLQDIGALPILNVLKQHQDQLADEDQVFKAVDRYAGQVGMVLLKHWNFDADMVEVARSRADWLRNPDPAPDLADLVLVARLHDQIVSGKAEGLPRMDEIPAFSKFATEADLRDDSSLEFLHQYAESVRDVMRVLGVDR